MEFSAANETSTASEPPSYFPLYELSYMWTGAFGGSTFMEPGSNRILRVSFLLTLSGDAVFFSDFLVTIVVAQTAGRIVTFLNRHGPPHQIDAKLLSPCFPLRFRSAKNLRPEIADNAVAEVTSRLFPFQDSLMVSIFSPFFHSFEFYQIS